MEIGPLPRFLGSIFHMEGFSVTVCLSVCLSVRLSVRLSVHLSVPREKKSP